VEFPGRGFSCGSSRYDKIELNKVRRRKDGKKPAGSAFAIVRVCIGVFGFESRRTIRQMVTRICTVIMRNAARLTTRKNAVIMEPVDSRCDREEPDGRKPDDGSSSTRLRSSAKAYHFVIPQLKDSYHTSKSQVGPPSARYPFHLRAKPLFCILLILI
jgi:hypothetical protein